MNGKPNNQPFMKKKTLQIHIRIKNQNGHLKIILKRQNLAPENSQLKHNLEKPQL